MIESLLFWSATTGYALATLCMIVFISFKKSGWYRAGFGLLLVAGLPHAAALILRWVEVGHGPYSTRYEVFSANALVLLVIFSITAIRIKKLRPAAILLAPIMFLFMGASVDTFGLRYEVPIIFKSTWLYLHIGFAKVFAACALMAGISAIGYLIREYKDNAPEWIPEQERLDLYAHQFLLVSFLALGVMIVAGSLWAHQSWGRYWGWDPIETSALVTWIGYGIILHFRVLHHWSGKRMAWLTLIALILAIETTYVVALFVPTIHNRYLVG